jgi:DNA invertase Pin-like site-specific DNA recombinase
MFSTSSPSNKKAIAYYRHSAEDKQENSVPIQREHAQKFAQQHQIDIIHEEADEGKTGLLANRPGFELIFKDWILNSEAPQFDYILVYDVSRWGRFQDQDEAAYYEFRCKQRGKKVIYVSRGFPKEEQQLMSNLQTTIERYMAAEYSRQLSEKVFYGAVKVSEQGYSAGGPSCYGMTRLLLDADKKPVKTLKPGEWKEISNERVTFTPANDESTRTVQDIFRLFVKDGRTPKAISEILNEQGIPSASGAQWNSEKIVHILANEIYTGARIYNKTWSRLQQKIRCNPRNEWVIRQNAFPAVIPYETFQEAQNRLYWLFPRRWKAGLYAMKRTKNFISGEIEKMIIGQGIDKEEADTMVKMAPIIFGIRSHKDTITSWCFLLQEFMRSYDFVIAVSVTTDQQEPIDGFLYIPTKDFDSRDALFLSEKDKRYEGYKIREDEIEGKFLSLLFPKKPN